MLKLKNYILSLFFSFILTGQVMANHINWLDNLAYSFGLDIGHAGFGSSMDTHKGLSDRPEEVETGRAMDYSATSAGFDFRVHMDDEEAGKGVFVGVWGRTPAFEGNDRHRVGLVDTVITEIEKENNGFVMPYAGVDFAKIPYDENDNLGVTFSAYAGLRFQFASIKGITNNGGAINTNESDEVMVVPTVAVETSFDLGFLNNNMGGPLVQGFIGGTLDYYKEVDVNVNGIRLAVDDDVSPRVYAGLRIKF